MAAPMAMGAMTGGMGGALMKGGLGKLAGGVSFSIIMSHLFHFSSFLSSFSFSSTDVLSTKP